MGRKAHSRRGEAANCGQCGVGEGVPPGEVGPQVKGEGEDKAQAFQVGLWVEELILKLHREGARPLIAPGGPPMDQFSFRNGERDVNQGGPSLK